jgi:hypothetical protein
VSSSYKQNVLIEYTDLLIHSSLTICTMWYDLYMLEQVLEMNSFKSHTSLTPGKSIVESSLKFLFRSVLGT